MNEGSETHLNCVYGSHYEDWMLQYPDHQFTFKTEEECCQEMGPCEGWFWYPNLGSVEKVCHFGKDYPAWMANYEGLLSSTEEECCNEECAEDKL